MKSSLSLLIVLSLLTGCTAASKAIDQASAEPDPAKALAIIQEVSSIYCDGYRYFCDLPDDLVEAEATYLTKAAIAGDAHALRTLYLERFGDWTTLQAQLKAKTLERSKTSSNADLLVAAASIYGNDRLGVINTAQQIEYLKRAWAAGDLQSAGSLAHLFARSKDYENAYLWSLRCNNDCSRTKDAAVYDYQNQIALDELAEHLSAARIASLQAAAAEPPQ